MNDDSETQAPRYPVRFVALRTGLTPHVLRAWERRYGVVSPTRSDGGQRLYSQHDIERLSRLRRLTDRGHAIGRIAGLGLDELSRLEEESPAPQASVVEPQPDPGTARDITAEALRAIRRLDAVELQAILERAAVTLGVPEFLDRVVAGTLQEIGEGWTTRSVSIAQEHLASAVVRRVLGWLLGVFEVAGSAPRIVIATPPGQMHELGALMVAVSAAAEGWAVTYLGPDLPVADLAGAARETGASAVAVSLVYASDEAAMAAVLRETRAALPEQVTLILGGAAAPALRHQADLAGIVVIDSLAELRALLRRLPEEDAA